MADPAPLEELRRALAATPVYAWMGIEPIEAEDGTVTVAMEVEERHANLQGLAHGGLLATLADTAMGLALRTRSGPDRRHVTIHLDVQFRRPARPGTVRATGQVLEVGGRTGFAEATVLDGEDRVLATARGTYDVGAVREPRA